ncbi:hydrogenase maturation protease [Ectothiorhodospira sp. BSL-9]|uniref:hydrogenase maturation protease n=1 Tax=Ectothiorhodospira sp. BSL-9 TaxID=1442136 RepID=UPI0007B52E12|nr:hydrogenase maturation protease [Ectothiorhodospira sp. BSL-9]TVQ74553.1 MAG: hydrogenase maturation protease [Chromatiaceae bacterium]
MGVLIIGIGSPWAEDTLGWEAVETLPPLPNVDTLTLDRPGAGLIEAMKEQHTVILVDAMDVGATPGTVLSLSMDDLIHPDTTVSSHSLGVVGALALGKAMGVLPPTVHIIGIQMGSGPMPDETRRGALAQVHQQIRDWIEFD